MEYTSLILLNGIRRVGVGLILVAPVRQDTVARLWKNFNERFDTTKGGEIPLIFLRYQLLKNNIIHRVICIIQIDHKY